MRYLCMMALQSIQSDKKINSAQWVQQQTGYHITSQQVYSSPPKSRVNSVKQSHILHLNSHFQHDPLLSFLKTTEE